MKDRDYYLKLKTLERDHFICQKCKLEDKTGIKLEAHHITPLYKGGKDELDNLITLCFDCHHFAPNDKEGFDEYMKEEMEGTLTVLMKSWDKVRKEHPELIKKLNEEKNQRLKQSMLQKASRGNIVSRAPFGYKIENKSLLPAENFKEIEEIFNEFLTPNMNLTQLSKKHNLSVNGLKKILSNFTYVGKIKFDGQIHQGSHQPLISNTLFNHVQNKLKEILRN